MSGTIARDVFRSGLDVNNYGTDGQSFRRVHQLVNKFAPKIFLTPNPSSFRASQVKDSACVRRRISSCTDGDILRINGTTIIEQVMDFGGMRQDTSNSNENKFGTNGIKAVKDFRGVRRRIRTDNKDELKEIDATGIEKIQSLWKIQLQRTMHEKLIYQTFRVDSTSSEYAIISSMLDPVRIKKLDQIVNPTMWNKFNTKRMDMIKAKCDDATILSSIESDKTKLNEVLQYAEHFSFHPMVAAVPYSENMNLLFHYARNEDVERILTSGLKERIDNGGGLGRGIHFTDNPERLMYDYANGVILICGVLLGDCLSTDENQDMDLIREPGKVDEQRRNFNDDWFDSIVGRSGGDGNEYFVYDRHQCIPLYMVHYETSTNGNESKRGSGNELRNLLKSHSANQFVQARKSLPTFSWRSSDSDPIPMPCVSTNVSPFEWNRIFGIMEAID